MLLTCMQKVHAQYDTRFAQYYMARNYYNPAYAGSTENLNLVASSRLEWVGVKGAPMSFFVTGEMPLTFGKTQNVDIICASAVVSVVMKRISDYLV